MFKTRYSLLGVIGLGFDTESLFSKSYSWVFEDLKKLGLTLRPHT